MEDRRYPSASGKKNLGYETNVQQPSTWSRWRSRALPLRMVSCLCTALQYAMNNCVRWVTDVLEQIFHTANTTRTHTNHSKSDKLRSNRTPNTTQKCQLARE